MCFLCSRIRSSWIRILRKPKFCLCLSLIAGKLLDIRKLLYFGKELLVGGGILSLGKFLFYKTVNYRGNCKWNFVENGQTAGKNLAFLYSENQTQGAHEKSWFIDLGSGKGMKYGCRYGRRLPIARVTGLLRQRTPCRSEKIPNSTLLALGPLHERKEPVDRWGVNTRFHHLLWGVNTKHPLPVHFCARNASWNKSQTNRAWGFGFWRSEVECSRKFQLWFGINGDARISWKSLRL